VITRNQKQRRKRIALPAGYVFKPFEYTKAMFRLIC